MPCCLQLDILWFCDLCWSEFLAAQNVQYCCNVRRTSTYAGLVLLLILACLTCRLMSARPGPYQLRSASLIRPADGFSVAYLSRMIFIVIFLVSLLVTRINYLERLKYEWGFKTLFHQNLKPNSVWGISGSFCSLYLVQIMQKWDGKIYSGQQ